MKNDSKENNSKGFLSDWLEKIQQDSWQLELLISGLALFGVYNGRVLIEEFSRFIDLNIDGVFVGSLMVFTYGIVYIGWRIFFVNLLLHVILRGLWIAAIGLRYVSDEIDYNELDYASAYTEYLSSKIGTYDGFIEKLEKLCSIIFAFTFLIFLVLVSLAIFSMTCFLPIALVGQHVGDTVWGNLFSVLIIIYLVLGMIVAIDFISLGSIKKIKDPWVVKLFSPVFKFFSYITLSFMYRPILYNFLDQKYTRRFFMLAIPYVILLGTGDVLFTNHITPFKDSDRNLEKEGLIISDARYEDLLRDRIEFMTEYEKTRYINKNMGSILLSNYHVQDRGLEFFIRTSGNVKELMSKKYKLEPIYKEGVKFNLFVNHTKENKSIRKIEKQYLKRYSELRKQYNQERDLLSSKAKDKNEELLKLKRDSINSIVDSLEILKVSAIADYRRLNNEAIFQKIKTNTTVKIDSIDYTDSLSCKYFTNQLNGAEGILCNLFSVNLPKGNQIVEFTRKRYNERERDSIQLVKLKVPVFID